MKDRRVARNVVPSDGVQARRVAFHGGFGAVGRSDSTLPPLSSDLPGLFPPPAEKSRAVSLKLFPGTRLESALKEGCIRVSASSLLLHAVPREPAATATAAVSSYVSPARDKRGPG